MRRTLMMSFQVSNGKKVSRKTKLNIPEVMYEEVAQKLYEELIKEMLFCKTSIIEMIKEAGKNGPTMKEMYEQLEKKDV